MIVMHLELVGVTLARNAPGQLVFNPVERPMISASIGLSCLAVSRNEALLKEVETEIKKLKSVQSVVDKNKDNQDWIEACLCSISPARLQI